MQYKILGNTGVTVSRLCLGAMMLGAWGNPNHDASIKVIHEALDAGINFIDTADGYSGGESRRSSAKRWPVVDATMWCWPPSSTAPCPMIRTIAATPAAGSSAKWRTPCAGSTPTTSTCTRFIALSRTPRSSRPSPPSPTSSPGKIRYIGSSSFTGSQIVEAQWAAHERHLEPLVTEQPSYSILVRTIEEDVLPTAARHGMGVLSYSPIAGGWLSGRWRKGADAPALSPIRQRLAERFDLSLPANQRKLDAAEALHELADEAGISLIDLAIAFVLAHSAITSAIIGPRTSQQFHSQLSSADVTLDVDLLTKIDDVVPPGTIINPADNSYSPWTGR